MENLLSARRGERLRPLFVGYTSIFVGSLFFEGCLSGRYNVARVEQGASPFYELLRNLHHDCVGASKMCTVIL